MVENKRINGAPFQPGDVFMLEGELDFTRTKVPSPNTFNPTQQEFSVTMRQTQTNPIKISVPNTLSQADQQRVYQAAQMYLNNGLSQDKKDASVYKLYLRSNARFTRQFDAKDTKDLVDALDPKSLIPTYKADDAGVYHQYTGNDPEAGSNPVSRVIINIYEYNLPSGVSGKTDGIQYVLFPANMVPFVGGGNSAKATIEGFGLQVEEEGSDVTSAPTAEQSAPAPAEAQQGNFTEMGSFQQAPDTAPANSPFGGTPADSPFGAAPTNSPFG